jgi:hypothetical protein
MIDPPRPVSGISLLPGGNTSQLSTITPVSAALFSGCHFVKAGPCIPIRKRF